VLSLRTANGVSPPVSVRALAAANSVEPPISLRALCDRIGSRTRVVRIAFVRYAWQTPNPSSPVGLVQWNDNTVFEVFARPNGWSVNEYWRRASLGLIELKVDLFPWRTLPGAQAKLDRKRGDVAALVRKQAEADGVPLDRYERMVALVHPPPGSRGAVATPGDVIIDEMGRNAGFPWHEFFEHEFGHLLGFEHAFGPGGGAWVAYADAFCVMGSTGTSSRTIPPQTALDVHSTVGAQYWRSGRRFAAAALYRYIQPFAASSSVIRVDRKSKPRVRLVAVSEGRLGDPIVAVVATRRGEVTLEYRTRTGDDAGVSAAPCVVLHSIGRRPVPRGAHEVNPIVYEARCAASLGSVVAISERDVSARVIDSSADGRSITLRVTAA
jgi:hypothetical protein